MHIRQRSRHYSPALRAEINALSAEDAAERAARWREIAADPVISCLGDWAVAAYFQSVADRKAASS